MKINSKYLRVRIDKDNQKMAPIVLEMNKEEIIKILKKINNLFIRVILSH